MIHFSKPLFSLLASLAIVTSAGAAAPYVITDLGTLPGFATSRATAINNRGQIVGWAETTNDLSRAFLWEQGVIKGIILPESTESLASGINEAGDVVGSMIVNGERHAFVCQADQVVDLGRIDSVPRLGAPGNYVPGVSLNDRGQVTGRLILADGQYRSFLRDQGRMIYFGMGEEGRIYASSGINEHGQIVGQSLRDGQGSTAFLWQDGKVTDLGTLGGNRSSATAINERGMVIGWSTVAGGSLSNAHAFVWQAGTLQDLGNLGGQPTRAYGLNASGQIVGYSSDAAGRPVAFVWENGRMASLNELVDPASGWRLTVANAINDHGQIVAYGSRSNQWHACLLTPRSLDLAALRSPPARTADNTSRPPDLIQLTTFQRLSTGAFQLGFIGRAELRYIVEASTKLVTWSRLGDATNNAGQVGFTDGQTAGSNLRFYRVVQEP